MATAFTAVLMFKVQKMLCFLFLRQSILTNEKVTIKNVPDLIDVENMAKILRSLGASVVKNGKNVEIHADNLKSSGNIPRSG